MAVSIGNIARVRILDVPYQADSFYDYKIPDVMSGEVKVGDVVAVLFGKGNRKQYAIVCEIADKSDFSRLKNIQSVTNITLSQNEMSLCAYMKDTFFCTFGEAVKTVCPTYVIPSLHESFTVAQGGDASSLTSDEEAAFDLFSKTGRVTGEKAEKALGGDWRVLFRTLENKGLITASASVSSKRQPVETTVSLEEKYMSLSADELCSLVMGPKQKDLLRVLSLTGKENVKKLRDDIGVTLQTVRSLADAGFIKIERADLYRDPYADADFSEINADYTLSESQNKAAERIDGLLSDGKPHGALLYGVTGSGKTAVIDYAVKRTLDMGKSVIMLLPEIALTPQAVGIFYKKYKGKTSVLHSGLSDGERYDSWKKMKDGKTSLCIGTRSAVFAPVKNLGLIVIDEEQEHTYKSDSSPRYHARDIARFRCAKENALMLLSSATPSLETYSRALEGRYSLITLEGRYGGASLPDLIISDMKAEDGQPTVGQRLRKEIKSVLEKKEQAILFVNRRGYNAELSCPKCGKAVMCPHCSVPYTYHLRDMKSGRGYLSCHWCGSKAPLPQSCPDCSGGPLRHIGIGTQNVEKELSEVFPEARILRLDSDTASSRFAYDEILGAFRRHEADILLGTQMVTKGHDFPDVSLVGVINADSVLYRSTFSASENAFSILTQVVGRAGRGDKRGKALIQTYSPHHPVINELTGGNYKQMFETELPLRRSLVFPPYCNMVVFTVASTDEGGVTSFTKTLSERVKKETDKTKMTVFGPIEAQNYRLGDVYRMQVVVKCQLDKPTRDAFSRIYTEALKDAGSKLAVTIDTDPSFLS